jgi:hypothetical protein
MKKAITILIFLLALIAILGILAIIFPSADPIAILVGMLLVLATSSTFGRK